MRPTLPAPRGELSETLVEALRGRGVARCVEPDSHADEALALWVLYELHHHGFDGVDDALEWDPALLVLRARLEHDLEARWRERTRWLVDRFADDGGFDAVVAETGTDGDA